MTRLPRTAPWLAACALVVAAAPASAGLLPNLVTVTPEAGKFRWTYAIVLPTDSQLQAGDYFTIFDFGGLNTGLNVQPLEWSYTATDVGPVPVGTDPADNPTLPNLTWTYSGPTIISGQTGLGNFWVISDYGVATESFFTARTHRTADGRIDTNITETSVPVPTAGPPPNLVPEPGTLALAGLGLPLVGLARVLRRKK